MRVFAYAPVHFHTWDWRSPDDTGIGGSEVCVVETARILASRGHDVTVFAPLRDDCPTVAPGGVRWLPLAAADFTAPGLWVLHRCPSALDNFPVEHPGQTTWLVCQDVWYPPKLDEGLQPERSARLDWCLPLCSAQERYLLETNPELAGKMRRSSNGLRLNLIEEVEQESIPRDPFRTIYTSSPDRGLIPLLKIFARAREFEPRLTLAAAYGFDNIKLLKGKYWKRISQECEALLEQPGVTWLGRLPQRQLYREILASGIWCYPTNFTETSAISCMESQAMGTIPITNPLWALADNVRHGYFIQGDPEHDALCRSRYLRVLLELSRDPALQEQIRGPMMAYARERFDWNRVVDQWEAWGESKAEVPSPAVAPVLHCPGIPSCKVVGYLQVNGKAHAPRPPRTRLDCNIHVTSVDRTPQFVHQCLQALGGKESRVFPDWPDGGEGGYVRQHIHPGATVLPWPEKGRTTQEARSKSKRAGVNYWRCLTFDRVRDLLLLEDDAVMVEGWEAKLLAALNKIPEERFILAVHHCWDWAFPPSTDIVQPFANPVFKNDGSEELQPSVWCGTPAVYYPASVLASELPEVVLREQEGLPDNILYDQVIGHWCLRNQVPVYLMTPPGAIHAGDGHSSIGWAGKNEVLVS